MIDVRRLSPVILVQAEGRTFDLPVGRLLTLDHDLAHDLEALEESFARLQSTSTTKSVPSQRSTCGQ